MQYPVMNIYGIFYIYETLKFAICQKELIKLFFIDKTKSMLFPPT